MGDPVGAARHARQSLKADGHWLLVGPFANDDIADNLNPMGRVFYSASPLICTRRRRRKRWAPASEPKQARTGSGR
jgi:hypothetical protein